MQKINVAFEFSLDVCLNFRLKVYELNPTKCILTLGQFSRIQYKILISHKQTLLVTAIIILWRLLEGYLAASLYYFGLPLEDCGNC